MKGTHYWQYERTMNIHMCIGLCIGDPLHGMAGVPEQGDAAYAVFWTTLDLAECYGDTKDPATRVAVGRLVPSRGGSINHG